ncbi:MAG: hypothetical protein ACREM3_29490 [Candidatus Rokuibacteriota bacterium]
MGKRFLHSIAQDNADLAASASIAAFDLPVNPLSMLLLRLQITNVAPAALDTYTALDDVITQITSVRVLHKGEQIIGGSLRDLMMVNALYQRAYPWATKLTNTDNGIRSFVFPLCLGRRPYDPISCFPATTRGNLRFELDAGADGAGYDDINFSVQAVELIEADPTEYVKYVTSSMTSVAGQFDARLPIGNPLLGILLFDTGLFGSDDEVTSWGRLRLLKDNVEQYYSAVDYEVLAGMLGQQLGMPTLWPGHVHQFNGAAVGLDDSDEQQILNSVGMQGYAWLDFDPLRDYEYEMETGGAGDLVIRATGDEASAVRWLPLERVKVLR